MIYATSSLYSMLQVNMQDKLWHHYCFVLNNNKMELACYVDGIKKQDRDITGMAKGTHHMNPRGYGKSLEGWIHVLDERFSKSP